MRQLGWHLQSIGVAADSVCQVFASPLPRTCESAQNVMDVLKVPEQKLTIEPKLIESQVGDRESQLVDRYNDIDFWFPDSPESFNGETGGTIKSRMVDACVDIYQHYRTFDGYVLLFSHGAPIYLLLEALTGTGERLDTAGYRQLKITPEMFF